MWEDVEKGVFRNNKRIRTVLKFENVLNVHSKNIEQNKKDMFLDFLAIETNKMPDNNYEMKIIFAGDSIIKVITEVIEVSWMIKVMLGKLKINLNTKFYNVKNFKL